MLAPSYRRLQIKRQRGISLSRTSSQQKFYQSTNIQHVQNLNQSFQCHEPKQNVFNSDSNFNQSVLKERNQNRMSLMPVKYKSSRQQQPKKKGHSHYRNRSILQMSGKQNLGKESSLFGQSLWQQAQSIGQMIELLGEYEKTCQQDMDLDSAQQARKRINQLQIESINTRRKQLQVEKKQYVIKTRRQSEVEKREFYEFWDHKILQARKALQQIQQKHLQQQKKQLQEFEDCIRSQPDPGIKYSSKVLETRRNLTSLIKSRKYKEAEHLKQLLAKREAEERQKWTTVCQQKILLKIKQFRKKQLIELQAFKLKLNSSFNQLLKEKQKQEERMSNKMKKMQVEAMKIPSALVKAKKQLLNQSKAKISHDDY